MQYYYEMLHIKCKKIKSCPRWTAFIVCERKLFRSLDRSLSEFLKELLKSE